MDHFDEQAFVEEDLMNLDEHAMSKIFGDEQPSDEDESQLPISTTTTINDITEDASNSNTLTGKALTHFETTSANVNVVHHAIVKNINK